MSERPMHIAVVGGFSSGKSALINALVGESVLPMGVEPVTAVPHRLEWASERKMTVVRHDNTTEDLQPDGFKALIGDSAAAALVREVRVGLPVALLKHVEIWDTPGFGSNILAHELAARKALADADIALWVTPIDQALNRAERDKLEYLRRTKTPVMLVVNKADLAEDPSDRDEAVAGIALDAGDLVGDVIWVSARTALLEPRNRQGAGMVLLEEKLSERIVQERVERTVRYSATAPRPAGANDVLCPDCNQIGAFEDRFCACGRSLGDQHRSCPACQTDNSCRRPRCRNCNLHFETWERAEALGFRAAEELHRGLFIDAKASLQMALDLQSNDAWSTRLNAVTELESRVGAILSAIPRKITAQEGLAEWQRLLGLGERLGVSASQMTKLYGQAGFAWADALPDIEESVRALEWWQAKGIGEVAVLREKVSRRDVARSLAAAARAEEERVLADRLRQERMLREAKEVEEQRQQREKDRVERQRANRERIERQNREYDARERLKKEEASQAPPVAAYREAHVAAVPPQQGPSNQTRAASVVPASVSEYDAGCARTMLYTSVIGLGLFLCLGACAGY